VNQVSDASAVPFVRYTDIRNSGTKFGCPHRHFRRCDSTNTRARELAAAGAPHGTVVTADEQTEGRGRQGRSWVAPAGRALLYSAIVREIAEHPLLQLAAALAVCDTAEQLAPVECQIKWPNDVWIDERKVAGILIEARPHDDWAVIGVGLNLTIEPEEFPPELRSPATSLALANRSAVPFGRYADIRNSGSEVLGERLTQWIDADHDAILAAFRARDALNGREITWDAGSGVAAGVDDGGNLIVIAPDDSRTVLTAGEVHLL
jgi:BirA family biotin operon repressor/biotin-[acetyl-CoA-carboxylase] ligase